MTAPGQAAGEPRDEELIARWHDGDEGAAEALVRRHTAAVARFLAASGAREDLDDLVQETFFRAFRRIGSFKGSAAFRTWLLAIGSNALRDVQRRRKRRIVLPIDDRDIEDDRANPHDWAVAGDVMDRVQHAVDGLTPMQRDVFLMRAQHGASYHEIAAALGTTEGAARVHYHHAVRRIKEAVE